MIKILANKIWYIINIFLVIYKIKFKNNKIIYNKKVRYIYF